MKRTFGHPTREVYGTHIRVPPFTHVSCRHRSLPGAGEMVGRAVEPVGATDRVAPPRAEMYQPENLAAHH